MIPRLVDVFARYALRDQTPTHGWVPDERETDMNVYDMGAPEPSHVESVLDYRAQDFDPSYDFCWDPQWARTSKGWKGFENGNKVYLEWEELTRRYGPLTETPA